MLRTHGAGYEWVHIRMVPLIHRLEAQPCEHPTPMTTPIAATLIPGDGIGPEIMDATLAVDIGLGRFRMRRHVSASVGADGVTAAGNSATGAFRPLFHGQRRSMNSPAHNATPTA